MKYFLSLIICCLFSIHNIAAQGISMSTILESTGNDEKIWEQQQISNFATGLNYEMPWLRKIELRLGFQGNASVDTLDGYLRNEDYYALVISPNNWRERKLQRAIKPAMLNGYQQEYQVLLQQALFDRYISIENIHGLQAQLTARDKVDKILQQKSQTLSRMLDEGLDIKFKDVMDVESDKTNLQNTLQSIQQSIAFQSQKIQQYIKKEGKLEIDFSKFISVEDIANNLSALNFNSNEMLPLVQYKAAQTALASAEYDLENAQGRQVFSFFQVGYSPLTVSELPRNKFNPSNDLAFRIGLQIPIAANNNLKRSEAALQLQEERLDMELSRTLLQKNINLQKDKVNTILLSYRQYEQQIKGSLLTKFSQNENLKAQITPLELLDLQLELAKMELRSLELTHELTIEYIRLLDLSGILVKEPKRNFLVK